MPTVRDLLKKKEGKPIISVAAEDTVFHALEVMAEHNIGAVLVTEGDRYVGIFSERDYARKIILQGRESKKTTVAEIMTRDMVTVNPQTTVEQCMELMTRYHIRHLPVVEEGHLSGLISIGDVVHSIISDQKSYIENLEEYIHGTSILR
ncbi:MAG: CBS domain-containing protein [Anaerolineales bacterium]|nr:CBS domain-containing protein [Anaerolineales bacterium]MCX7754142.1 CBS domain-containing protein [Anaerolineales bacterium]MDW8278056.1 CBS domain-containing protein [Anaerolineales bacterium]